MCSTITTHSRRQTARALFAAALLILPATYAKADGEGGPTIVVDAHGIFPPPGVAGGPTTCVTTPFLTAYSSIQPAVNAAPAGATILICPGTYPELVTIKKSVTMRGVTNPAANTGAAVITLPNGGQGVAANYADGSNFGGSGFASAIAQIFVKAARVSISNISVDASNTFTTCSVPSLIGIVFSGGASGTVSRVAVRNQNVRVTNGGVGYYCTLTSFHAGVGIFADASANSISVVDSRIHGFDQFGIWLTLPGSPVVNENVITGIDISQGTTCSNIVLQNTAGGQVNDNIVTSCSGDGIAVLNASQPVSVSANTISPGYIEGLPPGIPGAGGNGGATGIFAGSNSAPVTISYNTISGGLSGISVYAPPGSAGATIQNNEVSCVGFMPTNAVFIVGAVRVGIGVTPSSASTVTNNTINDAAFGIAGVSGNNVSGNNFLNVTTLTQP